MTTQRFAQVMAQALDLDRDEWRKGFEAAKRGEPLPRPPFPGLAYFAGYHAGRSGATP